MLLPSRFSSAFRRAHGWGGSLARQGAAPAKRNARAGGRRLSLQPEVSRVASAIPRRPTVKLSLAVKSPRKAGFQPCTPMDPILEGNQVQPQSRIFEELQNLSDPFKPLESVGLGELKTFDNYIHAQRESDCSGDIPEGYYGWVEPGPWTHEAVAPHPHAEYVDTVPTRYHIWGYQPLTYAVDLTDSWKFSSLMAPSTQSSPTDNAWMKGVDEVEEPLELVSLMSRKTMVLA